MPGARVSMAGSYAAADAGDGLQGHGSNRREALGDDHRHEVDVPEGDRTGVPPAGATVIPITIGGTVKEPKVGLDVVRAFTPK